MATLLAWGYRYGRTDTEDTPGCSVIACSCPLIGGKEVGTLNTSSNDWSIREYCIRTSGNVDVAIVEARSTSLHVLLLLKTGFKDLKENLVQCRAFSPIKVTLFPS